MTSARLHRCLEPGLSILIATVDAQNIPSSCRAVAIVSDDGLQTVTAYLPVATSHEALHNIALTKRLAIAATHPVDHCATQLKGTSVEARLAREDEAPFLRDRVDAFADVLAGAGVPRRLARNFTHWPAFAVTMTVEQIFDQTPGPNAGTRLR
jgi:hypothetical protein